MMQRKIAYSEIALSKRKAIKQDIKEKYGKERADKFSKHISKSIAELKKFPEMGVPLREKYDLECEYYMLFIEHNYFIYRIFEDMILILEIFNEKEDFMYQLFGIVTTSQDTIDDIKNKTAPIAKEFGISRMCLFGSYARGEATDDSDVDLYVDRGKLSNLLQYFAFVDELENVLHCHVDVVTTGIEDKEFLSAIMQEGVLLYEDEEMCNE